MSHDSNRRENDLSIELKLSDLLGKVNFLVNEVNVLKEANDKIDRLSNDIKEMKISVQFMNSFFERMEATTSDLQKEHKLLKKESSDLRKKLADMDLAVQKLNGNSSRLDSIERSTLVSSLDLEMVQSTPNEDVIGLVLSVAKAVNVDLSRSEVKSGFRRKPSNDRPGVLSVQLADSSKRDALIAAVKRKRLSNKDIGFTSNAGAIYAKEQLTRQAKEIYFKALEFKRKNGWRFIWIKSGRVFLREKEGCKCMLISSLTDIPTLAKIQA